MFNFGLLIDQQANTVPDSSAVSYSDILAMKDFVANNKTASKIEIALTKMMIDQPNIAL